MLRLLAVAAALLASATAWAHEPRKGPNGGTVVDAGTYHVELVARGTTVDVFVTDSQDRAVPTAGMKGTAILLVEGKSQRIALEPAERSRLTGNAPVAIPPAVKGAVQLIGADGKTAQGRFN